MPQIFQVLRCFKCLVFQVHQRKKISKFDCKLCGEKQSIKRHYALGTAKDCRGHVQKLNSLRGEIDENKQNEGSDYENTNEIQLVDTEVACNKTNNNKSKWSQYVNEETVISNSKDTTHLSDEEIVLELPKKLKTFKRKKTLHTVEKNILREVEASCEIQSYQETNGTLLSRNSNENKVLTDTSQIMKGNFNNDRMMKTKSTVTTMNKKSKWDEYVNTEDNLEHSSENDTDLQETNLDSSHDCSFTVNADALKFEETGENFDSLSPLNKHIDVQTSKVKQNMSHQLFEDSFSDWDSILDI